VWELSRCSELLGPACCSVLVEELPSLLPPEAVLLFLALWLFPDFPVHMICTYEVLLYILFVTILC